MSEEQKPSAGWYPHPSMTGTQRYWDGALWTDHIAPVVNVPTPPQIGVLTIAQGVALGSLAAAAIAWLWITYIW